MLQVSVAALLDNFICASSELEMEEKLIQAQACVRDRLERNPMEPLLIKLAREFTDSQDLSDRLSKLFKVWEPSQWNAVMYWRWLKLGNMHSIHDTFILIDWTTKVRFNMIVKTY